jgi:metal-responsive CopG/Arc/MetJ family transcriptional regulator
MKTIQMTLDEDLLEKVDRTVKKLGTTRSSYIRESLNYYLKRSQIKEKEKKHFKGYLKHPVKKGEFEIWDEEQVWD